MNAVALIEKVPEAFRLPAAAASHISIVPDAALLRPLVVPVVTTVQVAPEVSATREPVVPVVTEPVVMSTLTQYEPPYEPPTGVIHEPGSKVSAPPHDPSALTLNEAVDWKPDISYSTVDAEALSVDGIAGAAAAVDLGNWKA